MPAVTVVAAKNLIAAVAGQRHGNVSLCQLRDQERRDLRGIRKGLVKQFWQARYHFARLGGGHVELDVLGAKMSGDTFGVHGLIVTVLLKADREGMHRSRAHVLHQRDDGAGIDATGKECAQRHIRLHARFDGSL